MEKESGPDQSQGCEGAVFVSIPEPIKNGKAFDLPVFYTKISGSKISRNDGFAFCACL
jgi:hypothetical protein